MNGGHQRCVPAEQGRIWEKGLCDVVKDIKVRSSRVRVTFSPTDRVLLRDKEDTVEEPLKGRGDQKPRDP